MSVWQGRVDVNTPGGNKLCRYLLPGQLVRIPGNSTLSGDPFTHLHTHTHTYIHTDMVINCFKANSDMCK